MISQSYSQKYNVTFLWFTVYILFCKHSACLTDCAYIRLLGPGFELSVNNC